MHNEVWGCAEILPNCPASSTSLFFFWMGFLEANKMSSATDTRRRVERPKTKSAKVFDGLLISDRVAS